MQAVEQILLQFVYLFWVLVLGFLLVALQSAKSEDTSAPKIPVTGDRAPEDPCKQCGD